MRRFASIGLTCVLVVGCAQGGSNLDSGPAPGSDAARDDGGVDPNFMPEGGPEEVDAGVDAPPCEDDDGDGVCNEDDVCTVGDDFADEDGDGIPDACDCDFSGDECADEASCEDGRDGVICTCLEGYEGDGRTCDPVDCGPPEAPDDGSVSAEATTFGSVATHACDSGFDLVGAMTRTCRSDGTWSGAVATCVVGDCGTIVAPENGSVEATSTSIGATATYSCDAGYQLVGSATRTCQADRTWSGITPSCQLIECGSLSAPANGTVSVPSTAFGSVATYACNFGYQRSGPETRTCQGDGTWSLSAPTCPPVDCGALSNPSNGSVSYAATTFGSIATYACNGGYALSGTSTRTCEGSGSWSGSPPSCVSSGCGPPGALANGAVSAPDTSFGSTASYTCNGGFQILGSTHRVCRTNNNWTGSAPVCGPPLSCAACAGTFYEGERVVALVDSPSSASGVVVGQQGRVIAGRSSSLSILVEWQGWSSGHTGFCSTADCGSCVEGSSSNRWWTACGLIETARLTCACDGAYQRGDRVVAAVNNPASATGILQGHQGTVIRGSSGGSILVEWDAWSSGHTGNCGISGCGTCTASSTSNRWYVPCTAISLQ